MLTYQSLMRFSLHSKRSIIPRILKDQRFTRTGFMIKGTSDPKSKNFVERKQRKIRRPIDLSQVQNSHLYYDHQKFLEMDRERLVKKREQRQKMLEEPVELEYILSNLQNEDYLKRGSYQLLFNIKLMRIHHKDKVEEYMDTILRAMKRVNYYVHFINIYSFKNLITFAQEYMSKDQETWKLYYQNMIRFLTSYDQQLKPFLSQACSEDERRCYIQIFDIVMNKAYEYKFDLNNLIMHLDIQMRNYLRNDRIGEETYNKFENIENPNLSVIYFSHFMRVMSQRQDFYSDYDKQVKIGQLKEYGKQWQEHLMKEKQNMNERSKKIVRKNLEQCKEYIIDEFKL